MLMKFFKAVFHTFLILLLLLAGLVMLSFGNIPGGYKSFVVLSGSMMPAIAPGSLIIVKPEREYGVRDVVTRSTKHAKTTITHRIIEKTMVDGETRFRTQGDANLTADAELVAPQEILGRVQWIVPGVGKVVNYAQTKPGFLVMVLVPSMLIILEEIINIIEALKKKRKKKGSLDHLKVL